MVVAPVGNTPHLVLRTTFSPEGRLFSLLPLLLI
jgi:hypothetical protein